MSRLVPIAAVALAAFGFAGPTSASATAPSRTGAPVREVTISATSIRIAGPAAYHPGPATFKVSARGGEHVFHLLRFRRGFTLADLERAQRTLPPEQAQRLVLAHVRFLGGVDVFPGAPTAFTETLHKGTYYIGELSDRIRLRAIHVRGTPIPANAAPKSRATITGYDFGWRLSTKTLPAHGTVTIRSTGHQPHLLILSPVKRGTTRAQLGAYLRQTGAREDAPPPPFAVDGPTVVTALMSPGTRMEFSYKLPAGEYALLTFATDTRTGQPQALEGMYGTATLR